MPGEAAAGRRQTRTTKQWALRPHRHCLPSLQVATGTTLMAVLVASLAATVALPSTSADGNTTQQQHQSGAFVANTSASAAVGVESNNDSSLPVFDRRDEEERKAGIAVDRVPLLAAAGGNVSSQEEEHVGAAKWRRWLRHSHCENNGTFVNGRCECVYPYVGERCVDFACEHGLSVGPRHDPESLFFNRKCICDEDWAGELCNIPIADQCNERGQYINGRCKCHGYYFGPKCQYVGKCVNGRLLEGVCHCTYGWEGDYCDKIVCHHGYPDKTNNGETCVCPPRHRGQFCDECALEGAHILPFPNCTEEQVPYHARLSRERTDSLIFARICVLSGVLVLLALCTGIACILRWGRNRGADPVSQMARKCRMEERKEMLRRAIFPPQEQRTMAISLGGRRESRRCSVPDWNDNRLVF